LTSVHFLLTSRLCLTMDLSSPWRSSTVQAKMSLFSHRNLMRLFLVSSSSREEMMLCLSGLPSNGGPFWFLPLALLWFVALAHLGRVLFLPFFFFIDCAHFSGWGWLFFLPPSHYLGRRILQ
jgi:hypothetical protein